MKSTTVAILALLASITAIFLLKTSSTSNTRDLYEQWKRETGWGFRSSDADDEYRFKIFEQNVKEINEHNAKPGETYRMGINQFTGLSKQEFEEIHLTHYEPNPVIESDKPDHPNVGYFVDWVSYGAVSPVKNEGQCQANYAFSAVGAIEGISVIVYRQQQEYSAQELVDCTATYGNSGCNGGTMTSSFTFIVQRGRPLLIQESTLKVHTPILGAFSSARHNQAFSRSKVMELEVLAQAWNLLSTANLSQWLLTGTT
jgi:hypothetical protein